LISKSKFIKKTANTPYLDVEGVDNLTIGSSFSIVSFLYFKVVDFLSHKTCAVVVALSTVRVDALLMQQIDEPVSYLQ
jgi:hypothetical protein